MTFIDKILNQLKEQVLNLLDDLLNICPNETDLLLVRVYFETQVEPQVLMDGFIQWVYPWKEQIMHKDEKFFEENDHIFGPLPKGKVDYLKEKMRDGTIDKSDKEIMWQYFQVFISLIEQYRKVK